MRKSVRWLLGATLVLTAASFWPREGPRMVAAVEQRPDSLLIAGGRHEAAALPAALDMWTIEPARRDPFAPAEAPVAPQPQPAPIAPAAEPAPSRAPIAPSIDYRYLGRMTTPEGQQITLLARGDEPLPVAAGVRLDEGYVVESVGRDAVRLVHPSLGAAVDIPIPPAPELSR